MARFFNTAGPCNPRKHYMLPPEERLPDVRELFDQELYFVVHAPRQVGKTTAFLSLAKKLVAEGRYAALLASCEAGQAAGSDMERAELNLLQSIEDNASHALPETLRPPPLEEVTTGPGNRLGGLLRLWCERCPKPVVLFLDEIDALHDNSLITVLRQLREGYARRPAAFPQSVALIGLRDVRDYRVRYRPENATLGTSSPFNIKVESIRMRNFNAGEVARLYAQHTKETGQVITPEAAALGFELTQGQPWLVNALGYQLAWRQLRDRSMPITAEAMEQAKEILIERRDTHLDSLADKLREDRVRRVIEPILAGLSDWSSMPEDDLRYVEDLGLIRLRPRLAIANPIYHEVIPRALSWTTQVRIANETAWYLTPEKRLDMDSLLRGFADFWIENAEALLMHQPYPEAAPHLVLMAFLQRIVNGGGTIQREYAVGSGRLDLLIRWPLEGGTLQREALELKVWREKKPDPLAQGLEQLSGYLDRLDLESGTLVLFDRRKEAPDIPERTTLETLQYKNRTLRLLRA